MTRRSRGWGTVEDLGEELLEFTRGTTAADAEICEERGYPEEARKLRRLHAKVIRDRGVLTPWERAYVAELFESQLNRGPYDFQKSVLEARKPSRLVKVLGTLTDEEAESFTSLRNFEYTLEELEKERVRSNLEE